MSEQVVSEKEIRLATAIKALSDREAGAYRYFVRNNQAPVSPEKAEELFALYQRGSSCEEIRRLFPSFSLGQVVSCRVMYAWDERKTVEVETLKREVPLTIETAELETQEMLANLLHITNRRFKDAIKLYIATGDETHLTVAKVPVPTSFKELSALIEAYKKATGSDVKRVQVQVTGGVRVTTEAVKPAEAASIVNALLGEIQEAQFTEPEKEEPRVLAPAPVLDPQAQTEEDMEDVLVRSGMDPDQAQKIVSDLKKDG